MGSGDGLQTTEMSASAMWERQVQATVRHRVTPTRLAGLLQAWHLLGLQALGDGAGWGRWRRGTPTPLGRLLLAPVVLQDLALAAGLVSSGPHGTAPWVPPQAHSASWCQGPLLGSRPAELGGRTERRPRSRGRTSADASPVHGAEASPVAQDQHLSPEKQASGSQDQGTHPVPGLEPAQMASDLAGLECLHSRSSFLPFLAWAIAL